VKHIIIVLIALAVIAPAALNAGEIIFKNGDRLTGKITSMADGKMTIETELAGTITVDIANVRTFSTDEPVEMHLNDGTVLKQPVTTAPVEGTVATSGSDAIAAQQVEIADVTTINPPPVKWTGALSAGVLITQGNSETSQVSVNFDAMRRAEKDRITAAGQYLHGRQEDPDTGEDETTTDNWFVSGKYDYFVSEKLYWFTALRVEYGGWPRVGIRGFRERRQQRLFRGPCGVSLRPETQRQSEFRPQPRVHPEP
jgi:hypothetical protein